MAPKMVGQRELMREVTMVVQTGLLMAVKRDSQLVEVMAEMMVDTMVDLLGQQMAR